ncbi:hypothetical protein TWF281_004524 [Arthrobotrys megalospora]
MLPHLPLEIQLLILEYAPWECHPTLSLVCHKWRSFVRTSPSVIKNRYTSYTLPRGHANGPKTTFDGPLYHRILSYLTHYVRMDDGIYHPCYLKPASNRNEGGELMKRLLNPTFFANDPLSSDISSFDGKGKGKGRTDDALFRLNFNNIYAHERTSPWKYYYQAASFKIPTVGEFLEKNGRTVNGRLEQYYEQYRHADVLKVVMKYNQTFGGQYFLEFALVPQMRVSRNTNSHREFRGSDPSYHGYTKPGQTKNLVRKWEVFGKLKAMVTRKSRDGKSEAQALTLGDYYEGREVRKVWDLTGMVHVVS